GGTYQRGGGIYNASGTLTLISSTGADNLVGSGGKFTVSWGGGVFHEGAVTGRHGNLARNSAAAPARAPAGGDYENLTGIVTIRDSAVVNNNALNGGGIISSANGQVIADRATISGNQGGGIWSYGWVDLADSTVADNTGNAGVAGMDFRIERSTISGNSGL